MVRAPRTQTVQFTSSHDIIHPHGGIASESSSIIFTGGRWLEVEELRVNQSEGRWAGRCTHIHIGCNYTGKLIDCSANVGARGGTVSPIEAERVTLLWIGNYYSTDVGVRFGEGFVKSEHCTKLTSSCVVFNLFKLEFVVASWRNSFFSVSRGVCCVIYEMMEFINFLHADRDSIYQFYRWKDVCKLDKRSSNVRYYVKKCSINLCWYC